MELQNLTSNSLSKLKVIVSQRLTDQKRLERLEKIIENYAKKNLNMESAWDALKLSFGSSKGNKLVRSLIYRKAKSSLTRSSRDNEAENDNSRTEGNKIKDALESFKQKLDNPALSYDNLYLESSIKQGPKGVNPSQKDGKPERRKGRPLRSESGPLR